MNTKNFIEKELSYQIIGCAMEVYNTLGYGFLEKIYENALMVSFAENNIKAESQKPISVLYHKKIIGDYFADIIIENKIILELKTIEKIRQEHKAQLLNYLKATHIELGFLLNFAKEKLEYERFVC